MFIWSSSICRNRNREWWFYRDPLLCTSTPWVSFPYGNLFPQQVLIYFFKLRALQLSILHPVYLLVDSWSIASNPSRLSPVVSVLSLTPETQIISRCILSLSLLTSCLLNQSHDGRSRLFWPNTCMSYRWDGPADLHCSARWLGPLKQKGAWIEGEVGIWWSVCEVGWCVGGGSGPQSFDLYLPPIIRQVDKTGKYKMGRISLEVVLNLPVPIPVLLHIIIIIIIFLLATLTFHFFLLFAEGDGTVEPNAEAQVCSQDYGDTDLMCFPALHWLLDLEFLEWIEEDAECPYCEGVSRLHHLFDVCDVLNFTALFIWIFHIKVFEGRLFGTCIPKITSKEEKNAPSRGFGGCMIS